MFVGSVCTHEMNTLVSLESSQHAQKRITSCCSSKNSTAFSASAFASVGTPSALSAAKQKELIIKM